ncbi:MAG: C40 family peptidase [Lachnospiraceae bacterium]|nr:C40 family peptidase [Lachnospiraceae bacterium]
MDSILKKGLFLVTITGAITAFPATVHAEDTATDNVLPQVGIEEVLSNCYLADKEIEVDDYLVPTEKGEYLDMAFANVQSFLYIRSEPTTDSEWVGKLYPDYAAKIIGPVGEWTKVQSGTVTGYVYSDYIIIGNNAEQKAQDMIQNSGTENPEDVFTYAESREEEEARLAKEAEEAAARAQEEAAAKAEMGQAIVDYACQFIGNPYVWGGTSLTNGADCSGFVQSVFAHFGISLPRTTWDMEHVGTAVSYDQAIPGDIILYDGHVGIYMGNGQIVNAINSAKGIGILPATYTNIVTVRRLI